MKRKRHTDDGRFHLKTIRLFLDDQREPHMVYQKPDGNPEDHCGEWVIARTVEAAKRVLQTRDVLEISLDHDLGDGPTGYDLCKWMSENFLWPDNVHFHSMNPVGRKNMYDEYMSYMTFRGWDLDDDSGEGVK